MTFPAPSRRLRACGVLLLVLAATTAACSEETVPDRDPTPAAGTASTATEGTATSEPTPTETGTDGGEAAETVTVPVYFVGDTGRGPRLFREFRAVPADNPLEEAAALVVAGDTLDPDYRTLWPAVDVAAVYDADPVIGVEIAGDGFTERPDGMSKRAARLAIQQLVYTLQGVQQERAPVLFKRTGSQSLFGLPSDVEHTNAKQINVSSMVNVTAPEQGGVTTGDTLEASGVGNSFEATIVWEIRRGDEVVLDGFATAEGWGDKLYPWETSIDVSGLEPGDYTFIARTDDPSGGAEGSGPDEDTKDFTLE